MAVTRTNCIIGEAILKINGTDVGLTTNEGATLEYDETIVMLEGGQARAAIDAHLDMVEARVTFTIKEHSLAQLKTILDGSTAVSGSTLAHTPRGTVSRQYFELVGAGPNGASRRIWGTAMVRQTGGTPYSKSQYAETSITATFFVDPSTDLLFTIVDTAASGTAPTVASFQEVTSAGSESTITDPATDFAVTSSIQVTFSKEIAPSELDGRHFGLTDTTGGDPVAFSTSFGPTSSAPDMTKVLITPDSSLTGSANSYKLAVKAGVEALDGTELASGTHIDFSTPS